MHSAAPCDPTGDFRHDCASRNALGGESVHEVSPPSAGLTGVHPTLPCEGIGDKSKVSSLRLFNGIFVPAREENATSLGMPAFKRSTNCDMFIFGRARSACKSSSASANVVRGGPVRTFPTLPCNLIITRFLVLSTVPSGLLHSHIAGWAGQASAKSTTEATQEGKVLSSDGGPEPQLLRSKEVQVLVLVLLLLLLLLPVLVLVLVLLLLLPLLERE